MDENCGRTIDVGSYSQVRVQLTRYTRYDPNMRCELFLTTNYGSRMMVYIDNLDIEKDRFAGCHYDYLEVDDGSTTQYPYIAGKYAPRHEISNNVVFWHVQPPIKLRNSKRCSVSSLIVIE